MSSWGTTASSERPKEGPTGEKGGGRAGEVASAQVLRGLPFPECSVFPAFCMLPTQTDHRPRKGHSLSRAHLDVGYVGVIGRGKPVGSLHETGPMLMSA